MKEPRTEACHCSCNPYCGCVCHKPTPHTDEQIVAEFMDGETGFAKYLVTPTSDKVLRQRLLATLATLAAVREEEREQADYNVSMAVQAIDLYIAKDAEEYGVTPLHQKLHAYISKGEWWKVLTPNQDGV